MQTQVFRYLFGRLERKKPAARYVEFSWDRSEAAVLWATASAAQSLCELQGEPEKRCIRLCHVAAKVLRENIDSKTMAEIMGDDPRRYMEWICVW